MSGRAPPGWGYFDDERNAAERPWGERHGAVAKNILIINGHPDARPERFCAALANAYGEAASEAGHQVRRIDVGALDFALIRSQAEFIASATSPQILEAQQALHWADHFLLVFPLWQGGAPALLKGFLEQVFRYGVALGPPGQALPKRLLSGKTIRIVVTMGMPAAVFRWVFGSHGVRSLERGLFWLCGFRPIRRSVIGEVDAQDGGARREWLATIKRLGAAGA